MSPRLAALRMVAYFFSFVPLSLRELRPFLGKDAEDPVGPARQLAVTPYLTAGVLAYVAGALNPVRPLLILISAAAASFGGNSGLAWMCNLLYGPRIPSSEFRIPEIQRSPGMDHRRGGPGDRVYRGTGTLREVSVALASRGPLYTSQPSSIPVFQKQLPGS